MDQRDLLQYQGHNKLYCPAAVDEHKRGIQLLINELIIFISLIPNEDKDMTGCGEYRPM